MDRAAGAGRSLRLGLEFNCSCMCDKVTFREDLDAELPGRFCSAEKAALEQGHRDIQQQNLCFSSLLIRGGTQIQL